MANFETERVCQKTKTTSPGHSHSLSFTLLARCLACAAYRLSPKCIASGKCTPMYFPGWQTSTLLEYAVVASSRVVGTVNEVNATLSPALRWPGTAWSGRFYVRYYSYVKIRATGAYTFILTSSTGASAGRCQGMREPPWPTAKHRVFFENFHSWPGVFVAVGSVTAAMHRCSWGCLFAKPVLPFAKPRLRTSCHCCLE